MQGVQGGRAKPVQRCSCLRLQLLLPRSFNVLHGCTGVGQVVLKADGTQTQCYQSNLPGLGLQSPT